MITSFTEDCKNCEIKTIIQKSGKSNTKKYRYSLSPFLTKIIENVVYAQDQTFLNEN